VKQCKPTKTWRTTRHSNLLRHRSGSYYARAFAGGKEVWRSLKTSHYSVAQAKLAEFLKEHRERLDTLANESSPKMTFGDALKIHQQNQADDVTIKKSTHRYWKQIFAALLKTWSTLETREVRRITRTDSNEWARRFRKVASPTRYNNTIAGLRHVFKIAVESGVIYSNPADKLERMPVRQRELTLAESEAVLADCRSCRHRGRLVFARLR
jgi:hypothetical protein